MLRRSTAFLTAKKQALVIGGNGALGAEIVRAFKAKGWMVHSVDAKPNKDADSNAFFDISANVKDQFKLLAPKVAAFAATGPGGKFNSVVNVAGGWAGGGLDTDVVATFELMCAQSVYSSIFAAQIANKHLAAATKTSPSTLILPGAEAAKGPTSFMMGYGMAKAAVHHLVASIASDPFQLPPGARTYGVLPITLDTPSNRAGMPDADKSTWTPLPEAATTVVELADGEISAPNGALLTWVTKNGKTNLVDRG